MTLEKKEARRGLSGRSCSRKEYSWSTSSLSLANLSLICVTSDVRSSQAVFGYLLEITKQKGLTTQVNDWPA